jgi:hypothetical protein
MGDGCLFKVALFSDLYATSVLQGNGCGKNKDNSLVAFIL